MRMTYHCHVPSCQSHVTLHPEDAKDEQLVLRALRAWGWGTRGRATPNYYCPHHIHFAEDHDEPAAVGAGTADDPPEAGP